MALLLWAPDREPLGRPPRPSVARLHPDPEECLAGLIDKLEPTDYLIRLLHGGDLRACAWVTRRTISVAGRETRAAGIRGVMTDPEYRRRGYGRVVMERAHELMRSFADCEFGLLLSSVMAVPFYEAIGWRTVAGPVTCEQPEGHIDYTRRLPAAPVMALMRDPARPPPSGPIDVRGLPW
jgi:GNAT superfamily N-acetyltransferase